MSYKIFKNLELGVPCLSTDSVERNTVTFLSPADLHHDTALLQRLVLLCESVSAGIGRENRAITINMSKLKLNLSRIAKTLRKNVSIGAVSVEFRVKTLRGLLGRLMTIFPLASFARPFFVHFIPGFTFHVRKHTFSATFSIMEDELDFI